MMLPSFARALVKVGRCSIKATRRGGWFPILLPHHEVADTSVITIGQPSRHIGKPMAEALRLCDGSRTLTHVCRMTGVHPSKLVAADEEDLILLWPNPLPPAIPMAWGDADVVTVSPHLDDAALSWAHRDPQLAGRQIVLDVFSQASWWRLDMTAPDFLPRQQATRDAEEKLVTRLMGAKLHRLELPEALLRGHSLKQIFTTDRLPCDETVAESIRTTIAKLASAYPGITWRLPLTVGNHIDHRLVRDNCLAALHAVGTPPSRVLFYEDLPYTARLSGVQDFRSFVSGLTLKSRTSPIDVDFKVRLLRCYWSQLTRPQIAQVGEYAKRIEAATPMEREWIVDGGW